MKISEWMARMRSASGHRGSRSEGNLPSPGRPSARTVGHGPLVAAYLQGLEATATVGITGDGLLVLEVARSGGASTPSTTSLAHRPTATPGPRLLPQHGVQHTA